MYICRVQTGARCAFSKTFLAPIVSPSHVGLLGRRPCSQMVGFGKGRSSQKLLVETSVASEDAATEQADVLQDCEADAAAGSTQAFYIGDSSDEGCQQLCAQEELHQASVDELAAPPSPAPNPHRRLLPRRGTPRG